MLRPAQLRVIKPEQNPMQPARKISDANSPSKCTWFVVHRRYSVKKGTRNQQEEEVGTKYNNKEQRDRERERERASLRLFTCYIPKLQQSCCNGPLTPFFSPVFREIPLVPRICSQCSMACVPADGARSLQQNCTNAGTDGDNGPLVKFLWKNEGYCTRKNAEKRGGIRVTAEGNEEEEQRCGIFLIYQIHAWYFIISCCVLCKWNKSKKNRRRKWGEREKV